MSVSIFMMQDYRGYLGELLTYRCCRNKSYSLRAFARDLMVAPSVLSKLLNGKASLSIDRAWQVAERLKLQRHEQEYFVALVDKEKSGIEDTALRLRQAHAYEHLDPEVCLGHDLSLADFALLLKISLFGPTSSTTESALRFRMPPEDLEASCRRLHHLGWLRGDEVSGWSAHSGMVRAETFSRSESIRIFHRKVLELALAQLHHGEVHERYLHSLIFSFRQGEYEAFCRDLSAFCLARCDAYQDRDSHDAIFSLGVQLIPLSKFSRN